MVKDIAIGLLCY